MSRKERARLRARERDALIAEGRARLLRCKTVFDALLATRELARTTSNAELRAKLLADAETLDAELSAEVAA